MKLDQRPAGVNPGRGGRGEDGGWGMADGGCTLSRRSAFTLPHRRRIHPTSDIPIPKSLPRLILDTNLLVGAAYAPTSASGRLLAAATAGEVRLLVSPATFAEYRFIVPRAVRRPGGVNRVLAALRTAEPVLPTEEQAAAARGMSEDPDDDKFLALAAAGRADALLSNDHHLLDVGEYAGVPIRRPGAWERGEGAI